MLSQSRSALPVGHVPASNRTTILRLVEPLDSTAHVAAFAADVRAGLTSAPRTLPWPYFYDHEGSRLFEQICELPEYYLTRTEDRILQTHAREMVDFLGLQDDEAYEPTIVELGSGAAVKTQRLIAAALRRHETVHYIPIDVSPSALEESALRLAHRFSRLRITGYVADYRRGLEHLNDEGEGPRLFVFLGSSLGNYSNDEAAEHLGMIARAMRPDDRLLLGTDLAKNPAILEAAYDDAQGVTAAFNLNLLRRINQELGANFDLPSWRHRAVFVPERSRVEMHLVSLRAQTVHIPAVDLSAAFRQGETIHTENSHKYTLAMLDELATRAGFVEETAWSDPRQCFRVQRWRLGE